eukprot:scaffold13505_cov69-Cylindrotheca_fusiformis.AAC.3
MVVAHLFEQYGSAYRGLSRREIPASTKEWYRYQESKLLEQQQQQELQTSRSLSEQLGSTMMTIPPATKPKRKPCKASKFLASLAADLDVVTDWVFLVHTYFNDREYRESYAENPQEGSLPYLIPPYLIWMVFIVCVAGTFMWLILATDGAIITPLLRVLGIDKISMGLTLFLCVIVEGTKRLVVLLIFLTFLIEDYYEGDSELTNVAVVSVIASLYDTLIKLAEAFDERGNVVETGVWCKESLWAHKKSVTAIVSIPIHEEEDQEDDPELSIFGSTQSRVHIRNQQSSANNSNRSLLSVVDQAREVVSETKLPRLSFVTVSLDHTIRVWDTAASVPGHKRDKCIKTMRGHTKGVTCIAMLGDLRHHRRITCKFQDYANLFFLTGSKDGSVKMWNLEGTCIRTYTPIGEERSTITSIAYVNREKNFVSAHDNGTVRLWEIPTAVCLAKYQGHTVSVHAVCSLLDSHSFLSGSEDCSIRLWSTSDGKAEETEKTDNPSQLEGSSSSLVLKSPTVKQISLRTFMGHGGAVLSLECVEPGVAFLSGSVDKTARLWSVETGACLRVFAGHTDAVTTVTSVDQVTFLTGSEDKTIKCWDAFSTLCIRTYTGHKDGVTDVSPSRAGTFVSCSKDHTIKLWIYTSVNQTNDEPED